MIKILIVDDSDTEIAILKSIFQTEPDLEVIGIAHNGKEAVDIAKKLKPDIITMDILMPIMNGIDATQIIMRENPTPIVIISSHLHNAELQATYRALAAGALTVLDKPSRIDSSSFQNSRKYLLDTLRSMAEIKVIKRREFNKPSEKKLPAKTTPHKYEIIVMGASVGGPQALKEVLGKLPIDFPVPIVVVQHISHGFIDGYCEWLDENILLHVQLARNNGILERGTVYFAPDDFQCTVERDQNNALVTKLAQGRPMHGFCPSISVLFKSVAAVCHGQTIGVLLTGMGSDGADGLLEIKNKKGLTIVQDNETAVVFGMGKVAEGMGAVMQTLPLMEIAPQLILNLKA